DDHDALQRIAIFGAVQLKSATAEMLSVEVDWLSALWILNGRDEEVAARRTGHVQLKFSHIEVQKWKLADSPGVKQSGDIGSIQLQNARSSGCAPHDRIRIASLQRHVDGCRGIRAHHDGRLYPLE